MPINTNLVRLYLPKTSVFVHCAEGLELHYLILRVIDLSSEGKNTKKEIE